MYDYYKAHASAKCYHKANSLDSVTGSSKRADAGVCVQLVFQHF